MQNRSAIRLSSACATQFPQTVHSYLEQQSSLPHCIVHRQVYAQKNSSQKNYKYTKSEPSTAKILQKQLAEMVAASKLPAHRPAGQQSGRRRPNEDFEAQIQRIVKAKMAAKGGYVGAAVGSAAPVTPPKTTGGRLVPTPPIGPPPAHVRAPPEPKNPPIKPIIRPALPRASQPKGETPMIPEAKPMPRISAPRPSSAPGILPMGSNRSSSSSTEVPKPQPESSPVVAQPKAAAPPRFRLQELLIVSRGTKPECVQVTRRPFELQDPSWDIILKSLHKIDNPERDKTLQGHIGINRRMILQLVEYEPMQTAVLKAAAQALRSQKAAVIFECSQGRHRSVGAAGILYQILHPLIPKIKLVHASSGNWHSTCQGQCRECQQGPCPRFHLEIDRLRQVLLTQIEREYIEHCAHAFNYNKHVFLFKNPVGQVHGFGCQADQQHLGFSVFTRPSQLIKTLIATENPTFLGIRDYPFHGCAIMYSRLALCGDCLAGGNTPCTILTSKNQQKLQHCKNTSAGDQKFVCSKNYNHSLQQSEHTLVSAVPFPEVQSSNSVLHKCPEQPRKRGDEEPGDGLLGRLLSKYILCPSAFTNSSIRNVVFLLFIWWSIAWGEQVVAENDAQSSCLHQGSVTNGLCRYPDLILQPGYSCLDALQHTFQDDSQQIYNAQNLICTQLPA